MKTTGYCYHSINVIACGLAQSDHIKRLLLYYKDARQLGFDVTVEIKLSELPLKYFHLMKFFDLYNFEVFVDSKRKFRFGTEMGNLVQVEVTNRPFSRGETQTNKQTKANGSFFPPYISSQEQAIL
jgi:hypothetical protein